MPPTESSDTDRRLLSAYARDRSPRNLEALVERYRSLARSLAYRYNGGSEPFEDLLQVADLGLVKAIQRYDPERGRPFVGYAVPTILGELRRHFRDRVWTLRLPRALQEWTLDVQRETDRLTEELGHGPSVQQIAERTGLSDAQVEETLVARKARQTVSMDAPLRSDDESSPTCEETIGLDERGYDRVEADYACVDAGLEASERQVLELYYNDGLKQAEIAKRFGVSQMQVSRVSRRGVAKLLAAVQAEEEPTVGASPR